MRPVRMVQWEEREIYSPSTLLSNSPYHHQIVRNLYMFSVIYAIIFFEKWMVLYE